MMGVRFLEKLITFLFDIFAVNIAFFMTFWLRYKSNFFPETYNPDIEPSSYILLSLCFTAGWTGLFFFTGLYRDWYKESRLDEFAVVLRTIVMGMFILFIITTSPQIIEFAKTGDLAAIATRTKFATFFTYGFCMLFFTTANRFAMHTALTWLFVQGIAKSKVVIIGANKSGEELLDRIKRYPALGYEVKGFIDDDGRKKGTLCGGLIVFGTYSDIPAVIRREKITGIIISHVSGSANEILRIYTYCGDSRLTIYMVPSLMDVISGHFKTQQIFGVPLMILLQDHMPAWEAQIKRFIDIVLSALVLVVGSPAWLTLAAIIRATSPGPAIYNQERVGQNGKKFIMHKFRSMYQDAEKRSGPQWAAEKDPRITPVGRFIRKTRLDEIPQFYNVLKGEMSFVGPRPEREFFIEQLKTEIPWYMRRLKMKPGVTGWAQIKHKYDSSIEDVKQKVVYDLYYFENMSLMLDLKIMIRTFLVVLTGKGAH
jgi:exopolysaccharide biosynthesis polyprenyl glycosylphosphotransferase